MDSICQWAHERINIQDFILLDTETTSLDGEMIDLAILGADGTVIFDSLIKPVSRVSEAARAVHHISDAMLKSSPSFAEIWPQVAQLLNNKIVITYNADFDFRIMMLSLLAHHISTAPLEEASDKWHCLMERYMQHIHASRWQKLERALQQQGLSASNTHRALADSQAAYSLLKHLAGKYEGSAYQQRIMERERSTTGVPLSQVTSTREEAQG